MPTYRAPTRDTLFVVNEVLDLSSYANVAGFENASPDMVAAVIEEAGKFASEVIAPLNAIGDAQGCTRLDDGSVRTPDGFKDAFLQFREAGWGTLVTPQQFGGQGLPYILGVVMDEYLSSANQSFAMYPGLTNGAISALLAKASPELQNRYVPKMVTGEWTGTMNLTEPQAGTDLGLIRTRAVPQSDGSFKITGTKIFISAGEHDLAENIIHLVLAKTPDAPDSSKGISLFVVPKFLVNDDGTLGERNSLSCGGIEHKMGIHGNATCIMNYDDATGWLVGEENKGLAAMFIMMNAARLGVGVQGLAQAEVAYQNGVSYARERKQGRALTGPTAPNDKADPIIDLPDVRRMLMDSKALTEGLRALALWCGLLEDLAHKAPTDEERDQAQDIIGLLTPVFKGFGTDKGFDVTVNMQQVWGGHGYIVENGMEQFVRDARITMIYEGANGVQATDLVGRKLAMNGGRAIQAFFALVDDECRVAKGITQIAELAVALEKANSELKAATMWLMQNGVTNPNNAGASAYHYMNITGIVAVGLMWLRMAKVSSSTLDAEQVNTAFYEAKLVTARYFAERFIPDAGALRRKIAAGSEAMMALQPDQFVMN